MVKTVVVWSASDSAIESSMLTVIESHGHTVASLAGWMR